MIRRNIFLFKCLYFFNGLWLFSAMAVIYFEQVCHSYALAMLAFSLVNIAQCLAEVPCGIFSDRVSRKTTMVLGESCWFLNMLSWAFAGVYSSVFLLFLGSCLRGIGLAFLSGTDSAMIYETLAQIRKRKIFMTVLAKINSFHQLGLLLSALIATIVTFYFSLKTLVWLSVIPAFCNLLVVLFLVNPKNKFDSSLSLYKQTAKSISLFFKKKKLRSYALLKVLNTSLEYSVFRFESAYFGQLLPIYMVSIVRILQHALGCISFQITSLLNKINLLKIICYSTLGNSLIKLLGLAMNNTLSPFIIAMQNLFYGPEVSSSTTLLQKEYTNSLRATMDSIIGLVGSLGVALVSFLIGFIADFCSARAILIGCSFMGIGIAMAYHRLLRVNPPKKLKFNFIVAILRLLHRLAILRLLHRQCEIVREKF